MRRFTPFSARPSPGQSALANNRTHVDAVGVHRSFKSRLQNRSYRRTHDGKSDCIKTATAFSGASIGIVLGAGNRFDESKDMSLQPWILDGEQLAHDHHIELGHRSQIERL